MCIQENLREKKNHKAKNQKCRSIGRKQITQIKQIGIAMYMLQREGLRKADNGSAGCTTGVQKKYHGKQVRNMFNSGSSGVGKLCMGTSQNGGHGALPQRN